MKTWKLVSGIISAVLSVFVVFQSMMAGLANALEESGQSSGSAGLVVSICMLCGGIVSIVSRKNNSKGTNIALIILFGLATFTGFVLAGNYSDLYIWSSWCLINTILAIISSRKGIRNLNYNRSFVFRTKYNGRFVKSPSLRYPRLEKRYAC